MEMADLTKTICDFCDEHINIMETMAEREIAKDENGTAVMETYFTCKNCGIHYTVIITDGELRDMIEQRRKLQNRIATHIKAKSRKKTIDELIKKEKRLKEACKNRADILIRKYKKDN